MTNKKSQEHLYTFILITNATIYTYMQIRKHPRILVPPGHTNITNVS